MSEASPGTDLSQSFYVLGNFFSQVPLDFVVGLDYFLYFVEFVGGKVFGSFVRVHFGGPQDDLAGRKPDAVKIRQGIEDFLIIGNGKT